MHKNKTTDFFLLFCFPVSSFIVPIVLVSGIFGMNNKDLPGWPFWPTIGVTMLISIVLLILYVWYAKKMKKEVMSYNATKRVRYDSSILDQNSDISLKMDMGKYK